MLDVLIYLFENYYTPESCPDSDSLAKKLSAVGFEEEEIDEALDWLSGLSQALRLQHDNPIAERSEPPAQRSVRVFADFEARQLGTEAWGLLAFLDSAGVLSTTLRELVIERALALSESPVSLETMKVIVLMVLWSQEAEVDALILEELLDDGSPREIH